MICLFHVCRLKRKGKLRLYWLAKGTIKPKRLRTTKAKADPLHATKALGGRGGIGLIHSRPRHWGEWSGGWVPESVWTERLGEKWCSELSSGIHVGRKSFYTAVYPRRQLWTSYSPPWELEISHRWKIFRLCLGSKLDRPVVQPVARHYGDWATRLILKNHSPPPTECLKGSQFQKWILNWNRLDSLICERRQDRTAQWVNVKSRTTVMTSMCFRS
jgi:hypothetical protein